MKTTRLLLIISLYTLTSTFFIPLKANLPSNNTQKTDQIFDKPTPTLGERVNAQTQVPTQTSLATLSNDESLQTTEENQRTHEPQEKNNDAANDDDENFNFSSFNKPELETVTSQLNAALKNKIYIDRMYQQHVTIKNELLVILSSIHACSLRKIIGENHPEFQAIKQRYESDHKTLQELEHNVAFLEMERRKSYAYYQVALTDYRKALVSAYPKQTTQPIQPAAQSKSWIDRLRTKLLEKR